MSIDLPPEIAWVARLAVGQSWPKGDEDKLRALGAAWYDTAQQLDSITKEIGPATLGVRNSISGPVAEQFNAFTQQLQTNLPQMAEAANQIGDLGDNTGVQVEYAKLMVLAQLIWLAYELSSLSFTAPEAVPAAITSARLIIQMILRRLLVSVVSGVGFMVGMDALIQSIQILLLHDRTKWDTDSTVQAVEGGAIGGAIGGILGGGLGAFAPKFAGSLIGKLAVGGATGVITTATMTAAFGGDADYTSALTSGLIGALGGGKHGRGGEEGKTGIDPVNLKEIKPPDLHLPDVHTPDVHSADVHGPSVHPTDTAPAPIRTGSGDNTAGVKEPTTSDTRTVTVTQDTGTHSVGTPDVRTVSTPSVSESHATSEVTHGQTDTSVGTQERTSPRTTDTTVETPARTTASRGDTGTTTGSGLHGSETTTSAPTAHQESDLPGFETKPTDTNAGDTRPAETPGTTGITGPAVADKPTTTAAGTDRATNTPATSGDSNTATTNQTRPTEGQAQAPAQAPAQSPRVTTETSTTGTSTDGRTAAPVRTTSEPTVTHTESNPTTQAPADQPQTVHAPVDHTPVEHVATGPVDVHHAGPEHTFAAPDVQPPLPPHTAPPEPPPPLAPHEPVRVELGPIAFDGGSADLTAPRQQALNTTARQVADLGVRNARDGGGPPVVTVEGRANVLDQGLPHFGKSLKLGQERAEAVATALRSELKDRLESLQSDGPVVLRGEDVTVVPRSRGNQDFEPGSPEHTGDHVAVSVELPPPPQLESDPGTPHETHEQSASVVVPEAHVAEPSPEPVARPVPKPASPDWRSRLEGAPTARVHTERFDPARDPLKGNAPHSLAGSQTLVRSVVRRVQAENGTWVRHHTVELPVHLGHSGMSAGELAGVHERIQRAIDNHLNGGLELPRSGDQFHLDLKLVAGDDHPEAITIGRNDQKVPLDQRSWNVPTDPALDGSHLPRVVHEVLHYLGLKDEYQDPDSLFRRTGDGPGVHRDGLMGHDLSGSGEVPRRYLETIEDTVDHTAVVKDHPHGAPDAPETATRTDLPHLDADDVARWDAPHVLTIEGKTPEANAENTYSEIGKSLDPDSDLGRRWHDPAERPAIVKVIKEWIDAPKPSVPRADGSARPENSSDVLSRYYPTKDQAASAVLDRVKSLPMVEIEHDLAVNISQDPQVHGAVSGFVTNKLVPWLANHGNTEFGAELGTTTTGLADKQRLYLPYVDYGNKTITGILHAPGGEPFSTLVSAIHDVAELMYNHDDLKDFVTVTEGPNGEFKGYVLSDAPDPAAEHKYPGWTSPAGDAPPTPPMTREPVDKSFRGKEATPNQLNPQVDTAGRLGYPVSLGPSRTTGKMIRLAHEAGATPEEKKALAYSLFSLWYTDYRRDITDIHRYHFVMDMAANFGVDYDPFSRPRHPVTGEDVYGPLINDALDRHRANAEQLQRNYTPPTPEPPAAPAASTSAAASSSTAAQPGQPNPNHPAWRQDPEAIDLLRRLMNGPVPVAELGDLTAGADNPNARAISLLNGETKAQWLVTRQQRPGQPETLVLNNKGKQALKKYPLI
ncbi:WXG100-like domain-containing protein [Kitasatospora sp. NPDC001660]